MRLSISQIAWSPEDNELVAKKLQGEGVKFIDIAPSMQWKQPDAVTDEQIEKFRLFWDEYDIGFYAMQSLLYQRNDLVLFEDDAKRIAMLTYLKKQIDLGSRLGVKRLVFGSPENRKIGSMDRKTAWEIAENFFGEIARYCAPLNIVFCLEANPVQYNCDFITTVEEAIELVGIIDHASFGVNLDIGGSWLSSFNFEEKLPIVLPYISYIHISEPFLSSLNDKEHHIQIGTLLRKHGYGNYLGIEMRRDNALPVTLQIENALSIVRGAYDLS